MYLALVVLSIVFNACLGDPCMTNPCQMGELCIARGESEFLCINEKILRNVIFNEPVNQPLPTGGKQPLPTSGKQPLPIDTVVKKPMSILPTTEKQPVPTQQVPSTMRLGLPTNDAMKRPTQPSPQNKTLRVGNFIRVNKPLARVPVPVVPVQRQRTIFRDDIPSSFSTRELCKNLKNGDAITYPFDNSKYIVCNTPTNDQIMDCPPGLKFNSFRKRCDFTDAKPQPACLSNPCQNMGVCTDLPDFHFRCDCPNDFTGERCEKSFDPCSTNPCGLTGLCFHFGFISRNVQHYCLCDSGRSYGLSCDGNTFENPCLSDDLSLYHAVPFSPAVFIHCEAHKLNMKACNPPLVWSDAVQGCDRP